MMEKIPITAAGYARMQEELKELKLVERPAVIKAIAAAREHGDLSENAEYHAARAHQSFIEGRICALEEPLSRAQVIDLGKLSAEQVKLGATGIVRGAGTAETQHIGTSPPRQTRWPKA